MDEDSKHSLDSLPPMSADALPRTLPPRARRSLRQLMIVSATILQGAGLFAGLLTYFFLFDPVLGEYRVFGALLVSCAFLVNASSLVTHLILYKEIRTRKR